MTTRTMRASKRWMVAAAAAAVGASALVSTSVSADPPDFPVYDTEDPGTVRVAGENRFGTAAGVSEFIDAYGGGCPGEITIANGLDFPDALAGSSAKDPILLTGVDALPAETMTELMRIQGDCGDQDFTIVGGTSVVSQAVFEALDDFGTVSRVSGANRYETAIELAAEVQDGTTVIIATGLNFPDALSAGVIAGGLGANTPILLNDGDTLRPDVDQYIEDAGITDAIIVGGTAVIPQTVQDELDAIGLDTVRLAGANRFETAVAVAGYLADPDGDPTNGILRPQFLQSLILANGFDFPDALAGVIAGQVYSSPLLLVDQCAIPAATAGWHVANSDTLGAIGVVGGTAVVCDAVLDGAAAAATAVVPAIESATLELDDFVQRELTLNNGGNPNNNQVVGLTAVPGSAADGPAANPWVINFFDVSDAEVTDPNAPLAIEVDATATPPEFNVSAGTFDGITGAAFVAAWDASDAGALLEAEALTTPAFNGKPNVFEQEAGSVEVMIVTTFNRPIQDPTLLDHVVYDRPGAAGTPVIDMFATTQTFSDDDLTVTATATVTNPTAVPQIGNDEVRVFENILAAPAGFPEADWDDGVPFPQSTITETLVAAP